MFLDNYREERNDGYVSLWDTSGSFSNVFGNSRSLAVIEE
jgi:hypothetical protein